ERTGTEMTEVTGAEMTEITGLHRETEQRRRAEKTGSTGVAQRRSAGGSNRENEHLRRTPDARFHDSIHPCSSACTAGRPVEPATLLHSVSVSPFLRCDPVSSVHSVAVSSVPSVP